jgi:PAS domain-containing protein
LFGKGFVQAKRESKVCARGGAPLLVARFLVLSLLWQARMTRTHPFQTVDAFTSSPFRGNPAAVLRFGSSPEEQALARDDDLMQKIAAEFNLAETAFCRALGEEETAEYEIRWRTPTVEVRL